MEGSKDEQQLAACQGGMDGKPKRQKLNNSVLSKEKQRKPWRFINAKKYEDCSFNLAMVSSLWTKWSRSVYQQPALRGNWENSMHPFRASMRCTATALATPPHAFWTTSATPWASPGQVNKAPIFAMLSPRAQGISIIFTNVILPGCGWRGRSLAGVLVGIGAPLTK